MGLPRYFAPAVLFVFAVIVLAPILYMIVIPFWGAGKIGIQYFLSIFDERQLSLAANSLVLAGGATTGCLLVGVPLAFLLERTNMWGGKPAGIVYIIPVLIPPYIHAIVWNHTSRLLGKLGFPDVHNLGGAVFVLALAYFPFITLMASSGLKSIDRSVEEAGLLTHGKWQTLRRITLPLVLPHIISGAIFVFIFCLINFGVPDLLRVKVFPVEIFIQYSAFYDERAATVLSIPLFVMAFLLLFLQKRIMRNRFYVQISAGASNSLCFALGSYQSFAVCFCSTLFALSVLLPIGVLLKVAGPFATYLRVMQTSYSQICYSILLAGGGAFAALLLSSSLAYLIEQNRVRAKAFLEYAAVAPLAIPAVTLGIGLIKVWNRPLVDFIYTSSVIIVIGYAAHYLPFAMLTISSGMKQLNPRLGEAGFMHCRRWLRVLGKIVLPLLRPSMLTGFFIVFLLSFGDLGTTLLVLPPGKETIPVKAYNLMHYGAEQLVAALCLILVAVILVFASLTRLYYKKISTTDEHR